MNNICCHPPKSLTAKQLVGGHYFNDFIGVIIVIHTRNKCIDVEDKKLIIRESKFMHTTLSIFNAKRPKANSRGGVEDTRLEAKAKAKDTKKIRGQGQGQGQPFRGQTLSRPRTGMLEAKAKDQGHKAQVLSKKKKKKRSSQKFFRRSPLKNVFQKIFQALHKILTFQKIVLSSSRGQANFRGLEASRPRPRPRT